MNVHAGDALIIEDVQQDFLAGGALAVPDGDAVIQPLNRYARMVEQHGLPVFATRDWHPPDHCSFRAQGGPWPPHCIAGTPGAQPPASLVLPAGAQLISKATTSGKEAYSSFQDTDLALRLRERGTRRVFIGGLATDYCVRATVLDALQASFEVVVLEDAIRAVDVRPGDGARALAEMMERGARVTRLQELAA